MEVVNKNPLAVMAGLRKAPPGSRIISVRAAAAGLGVWGYGYSPAFGKETRLIHVAATVQLVWGGAVERCHFSIHRGGVQPTRRQDVEAWDRIIDFGNYAGVHGICIYGPIQKFYWTMDMRFKSNENRFGVLFYNSSTNNGIVYVFFTVLEG